ncbi:MAG TPA: hypothetical protein VFP55_12370 [Solirubrobacteraceae bacterium]|nr:hypothetical protein [Solirubrobacteraceae bacterium]
MWSAGALADACAAVAQTLGPRHLEKVRDALATPADEADRGESDVTGAVSVR